MFKGRSIALIALVVLCAAALAGCTPATPEERVAELRSRFEARVNGFYVQAEPQMVEPMLEPGEAEEGAEAAAETGDEEEPIAEEFQLIQNAHLDLILQHDNDEMLPGITVEIFMIDAAQAEKGRWRLWVDTSTLRKANQLQLVHVLEDVPYVEGDGFAAEIRTFVPEDERSDYEEFANLGS